MNKIYIVRKYVQAKSLKEAVLKEKKQAPDDVWMSEESLSNYMESITKKDNKQIGYKPK